MRILTWISLTVIFLLTACGKNSPSSPAVTSSEATAPATDAQTDALRARVMWTKRLLNRTANDPMLAQSLTSTMETGGDIISFIVASAPVDGPLCYERNAVTQTWCIAIIPGTEAETYIIEGYGENLHTPLYSEQAKTSR